MFCSGNDRRYIFQLFSFGCLVWGLEIGVFWFLADWEGMFSTVSLPFPYLIRVRVRPV